MSNTNTTSPRPPMRRLPWLAVAAIAGMLAIASSTTPTAGAEAADEESVDIAVVSYASDYGVSHAEAQRRLDRIQPLQTILASIRTIEAGRLAGWGIDHAGTFTGWVWLAGNEPPAPEATGIAAAHPDIEIRVGAAHTLTELLDAQTGLFQDIGPVGRTTDDPDTVAQIRPIVTYTDIDMAVNAILIGIDPSLAEAGPGPVAVTDEALQAKIAEITLLLQGEIDVPYIVEDGRGMSVADDFKGGEADILTTGPFTIS